MLGNSKDDWGGVGGVELKFWPNTWLYISQMKESKTPGTKSNKLHQFIFTLVYIPKKSKVNQFFSFLFASKGNINYFDLQTISTNDYVLQSTRKEKTIANNFVLTNFVLSETEGNNKKTRNLSYTFLSGTISALK